MPLKVLGSWNGQIETHTKSDRQVSKWPIVQLYSAFFASPYLKHVRLCKKRERERGDALPAFFINECSPRTFTKSTFYNFIYNQTHKWFMSTSQRHPFIRYIHTTGLAIYD